MRRICMIFAMLLALALFSGCATAPMKFANQQIEHEAKAGAVCLQQGNTDGALIRFQNILQLTGCWGAIYGKTTEDVTDATLGIAIYRMQNDRAFQIGRIVSGAIGGYLGFSGTQAAVGGGLLLSLMGIAGTFIKKYLNKKSENEVIKSEKSEIEKFARENVIALETVSRNDAKLGALAKDSVRRGMLKDSVVDKIVQDEVKELTFEEKPENNS